VTAPEKHSYCQILQSSAMIGVSSVVEILFRIIRVKAMALWLGPSGVGLLGLYSSLADLAQIHLLDLAKRCLAVSAVRHACQAHDSGRAELEPVEGYLEFARSVFPGVVATRKWRGLERRWSYVVEPEFATLQITWNGAVGGERV